MALVEYLSWREELNSMKNTGIMLAIFSFFLLVSAGVFSVVVNFLDREFVDIYRVNPPPTFKQLFVGEQYVIETESEEVEDAYAMEVKTGDAAKAMSDFEIGREKSRSEDRTMLLEARDHLMRVVKDYQDEELMPEATLYLGRVLVKLKDWSAAKEQLGTINKNKGWLDKLGRAESNFLYGLCLEKLGKTDDAIKVYNSIIAVYSSYAEWSLQSLGHGFELAYRIDDHKKKIKAYIYLKKVLYMFRLFGGSGQDRVTVLMKRLRERRDEVEVELGISKEKEAEIDKDLGISWENMDRAGEPMWVLNKVALCLLVITSLLTIFSTRKRSERYWRYFLALFLTSVMAGLGYWANAEMMEIIHLQQRVGLGETDNYSELVANGEIYRRKLSFAGQILLGFFVMMIALVFRKFKLPIQEVRRS